MRGEEVHGLRDHVGGHFGVVVESAGAGVGVHGDFGEGFGGPFVDGDERAFERDEPAAQVHARETPEDRFFGPAAVAAQVEGLHQAGAAVEVAPPGFGRAAEHFEHAEDDA